MLKSLIARLTQPEETTLPPEDCRLALTALMIHVARADGHFDDAERSQIEAILAERFALHDPSDLIAEASQLQAAATDTVPLTRMIKDAVPYEERLGVVEALWQIALADGTRSDDENALLRLVVSLIGVSDRESGLARQRVAARL